MATIRYDAGEGEVVELAPMDDDFTYDRESGHWVVKVGQTSEQDEMAWIPRERVIEVRGRREHLEDSG